MEPPSLRPGTARSGGPDRKITNGGGGWRGNWGGWWGAADQNPGGPEAQAAAGLTWL